MAWARTLYLACFCAAVFTDSTLSLPLNHDLIISRKIRSATDDVRIERVVNETTGTIQDVCIVDRVTYREGDAVPTNSLCETCLCQPPGFACTFTKCDFKPGCRPIERPDRCCPDYACNCEMDGRTYLNGEKIEDLENPCQACYCQGGSIRCLAINCFWRDNCEPRERPGRCCPSFDHCPPTLGNTTVSSPASERSSQLPPISSAGTTNKAASELNTTEEGTTVDTTTSATPTVTMSDVVAETFTGTEPSATTVEPTTVAISGSTTTVPTLLVTNASAGAEVIPEQRTTEQQLTSSSSSSSSSQLPTLAKSVVMDHHPSLADGVRLLDLAAAVVGQQPIPADSKAINEIPEAAVDPGVASNIDMVMGNNNNNNPGNNEALMESAYEDILADQAAADLMDSEELYEQGVEQDYPEEQMPMDPAGALSISRTGMDAPAYDDEDLAEDEIAAEEDAAAAAGLAGMLHSPGQLSSSMADPRQQQQLPLLSSARPAVQHQRTPSGLLVMSGDHQHGGSAGGGVVDLAKLFPVGTSSSKRGPQPMFPLSQEETEDDRGSAGALDLEPDELAEALLMTNSDKANQPLDLASNDIPLDGKTPQQPSWGAPEVDRMSASSTPTAVMSTSGISNAADSLLSTSAGISQSDSSPPSSTLNNSGVIMADTTTTAPTTLDPMTTAQPTDSTSDKVEESTSTTDAVTSLPASSISNDQEVAVKAETTTETQSTTAIAPELTMTTTVQPAGTELSFSTVTMLDDSAGTEATTPVIDAGTITATAGTPTTATERTEAITTLPIRRRDDVVNDPASADDTEDLFNNQAAAFLQSLASGVQGQDDAIGSAVATTTLAPLPTSTDVAELTTAEAATTLGDNEETSVTITVAPEAVSSVGGAAAADEEAMHLDSVAAVAGPISQDDDENQEAEASTQPPVKASPTTDAVEVATTDAPAASPTVTVEEVQENEEAEATTLNSPSMQVAQPSEESSGADTSAVDESTSETAAETTTEDATEGQDEAEMSPIEARFGGEEVLGDQDEPAGELGDVASDGTSESPKLDEDEARTTSGSSVEAANEATTVEPSLVDDTKPATASTVEETAESREAKPAANAAQDDSATEELDSAKEQEEEAITEATVEEALREEAAETEEPGTAETEAAASSPTTSPFDGQQTVEKDEAQVLADVATTTVAVPVTETQASNEEREDEVTEESTTTAVDDDSTAAPVDAPVVPAVVLDTESQNLENQAVVAEDEDSEASNSQQESASRSLDDNHHDTGMDESTSPLPVPVFEVPIVPEKYPQLCGTDEKEGDSIGDWIGADNEGSQQRNSRRCRKQEETEEDNQIDSEEQVAEPKGIKEQANAHEEKEDIEEPKEDELIPDEPKEEEEVDAPKEEENKEDAALTLPTTVEPPTTESDDEEADDRKQEDLEEGAKEDEAAVAILEEHGGEPAASDDGDENEQDDSTTPLTTAEQPIAEEESSTDEPESTDNSEGLQEDAEPADANDKEESATDEPETTNTDVEENTEPAVITEGEESTDEPSTTDADTEEGSDRVPPTAADDGVLVQDDTTNNGEVPATESTDGPDDEVSQPESTTVQSATEEEATSNKQELDSSAALPSDTVGDEKTDEDRTEGAIELSIPVPDATSTANKARRIDGPIVDKVPQSLSTELTIEAGLRVSPEISDDDVDQSARETNWKNFISLLLNNSSPSTPSSDDSLSVSPPAAVGDQQQQTDSEANSNTEPSVADDAAILFQSLVGSPLLRKLVL